MLLPAGIPLSFSAQFNNPNPARVAISVYDDSGTFPVLLLSPFAMAQVVSNIYRGKFTAVAGKAYIVVMAVYTDNTFATLDLSFTEITESVNAQNLNPPVQSVIGTVDCGGGQ